MRKTTPWLIEEEILELTPKGFRRPRRSTAFEKMKTKFQKLDAKGVDLGSVSVVFLLVLIILVLIIVLASQPLCNTSSFISSQSSGESFVIVADGEVAEYQSTTLGIYDRVKYKMNGASVFVQRGGQRYVYRGFSGWWYANGNLGAETGVLRTKDLNATGLSWYYGTGGSWVHNDTSIAVVPLSSPLAYCLECKRILISSTGRANEIVPEFLGNFTRLDGIFRDGRPVYVNKNGKYFHKDSKATYGVRSKFTGDGVSIQSASGPICAFLEKASHSDRFGHGWRFWKGDDWETDLTLGAKCIQF